MEQRSAAWIGIAVALLAIVASFFIPEVRGWLGLGPEPPVAPTPEPTATPVRRPDSPSPSPSATASGPGPRASKQPSTDPNVPPPTTTTTVPILPTPTPIPGRGPRASAQPSADPYVPPPTPTVPILPTPTPVSGVEGKLVIEAFARIRGESAQPRTGVVLREGDELGFRVRLPRRRGYLIVFSTDSHDVFNVFPGTARALLHGQYRVPECVDYPVTNVLERARQSSDALATDNVLTIGPHKLDDRPGRETIRFVFDSDRILDLEPALAKAKPLGRDVEPSDNAVGQNPTNRGCSPGFRSKGLGALGAPLTPAEQKVLAEKGAATLRVEGSFEYTHVK